MGTTQKRTEKTKVIFRTWRGAQGGVIALFPEIPADVYGHLMQSYEHVGQHGGADCIGITEPVRRQNAEEVAALKAELESIGYSLDVKKRATAAMDAKRREAARRGRAPNDLRIESCGQCDCYHPEGYAGDCRDDNNRYASPEDAQERNNGAAIIEVEEDGSWSVVCQGSQSTAEIDGRF